MTDVPDAARHLTHRPNLVVTGDPLSIDDVVDVARGRRGAGLDAGVAARMAPTREVVERAVAENRVMYGITTGFGALANTRIAPGDLAAMQLALIRSHAAGVGDPLSDDVVRALLLLRARTLSVGISGVRVDLPQRLLLLLERGLLPVIPDQGSVGASGDLAQLAHLALPLVGEGRLRRAGDVDQWGSPASELLAAEGIDAAGAAAQGGAQPDQRDRADAGATGAVGRPGAAAGARSPTWRARCRWTDCSAPTAPSTPA